MEALQNLLRLYQSAQNKLHVLRTHYPNTLNLSVATTFFMLLLLFVGIACRVG